MNSGNRWFAEPDRATTPVVPSPAEGPGAVAPVPAPNVGTPLYDEIAAAYTPTATTAPNVETAGPVSPPHTGSTDTTTPDLPLAAAVLGLYMQMKKIEAGDGSWGGGDTVAVVSQWFGDFGIDIDADEIVAARSLRIPSWLAFALTAPTSDDAGLVIHVRTDDTRPLDSAHPYLAALVQGLGGHTSAAVFDVAGDQIAHFVHPAAD